MKLAPWRKDRTGNELTPATRPLADFRTQLGEFFDRFARDPWGAAALAPWLEREGFPRLDMIESDKDITLKLDVPGVKPEDIDIDVAGSMLTIRGEKKVEREERGKEYRYSEREQGTFMRSVPLPASADPGKVEAVCKDGVLTVTIAKAAASKARRVNVKGG